jgi:hypothetical protein
LVVNVACTKRRSWPAATMLAGIAFLPSKPGTISLLPEEMQRQVVGTPSYGSFLPSTNQLDPSLSFQFSTSPEAQLATQGSDPVVTGFVSGAVLAPDNALGLGGGATSFAPTIISGEGVQTACGELARQLQSLGKYWNGRTVSGMPGLLAANSAAVSGGGNSSNLSLEGRAGAWCRPAPVPFADSSPLASRAFWQPIAVVSFGVVVFWLSRGVRLPP